MGKILGRGGHLEEKSKLDKALSMLFPLYSTNLSEGFVTQNANNKSFRCGEHGPWDRSEGGSDTTAKNIIERPNARRLLYFSLPITDVLLSFSLCQSLDGDGLRIEQWRIPFAESSLFFPGKWERSTGKYFGRRAPLCRSVGRPVFLLHRIAEDGKKVMAGDGQRRRAEI